LVRPQPFFSGFDDFVYEFYIVPLTWALANLRTCWPERGTFLRTATNILEMASAGVLTPTIQKVLTLADSFDTRPLLIPVFLHRDLKVRWAQEYPAESAAPDDALIAEDGNKRLTALAVRSLREQQIEVDHIGMFVGHLQLPKNVG
jgi:hypothetical protein